MHLVGDTPVGPDPRVDEQTLPPRVFLSYRRADDGHFVGRVHDRLCGAFGDEMVFRDIDSIPAGSDFRSVILHTLNEIDVVVAVIGPYWVRPTAEGAEPDFVYLELAEALKQGKPVIPVLMESTSMPSAEILPSDLGPLAAINAITVHGDPAFRRDSARLVDTIRRIVDDDRDRIRRAQQAAEEQRMQAEDELRRIQLERSERLRLAEQLRNEERLARARLAELEAESTQRRIEIERARLAEIAERLREAETTTEATTEPAPVQEEVPAPIAALKPSAVVPEVAAAPVAPEPVTVPEVSAAMPLVVPGEVIAEQATPDGAVVGEVASERFDPDRFDPEPLVASADGAVSGDAGPSGRGRRLTVSIALWVLLPAALVLAVAGVATNHSEKRPFTELSLGAGVDVATWILTFSVAAPLLLWRRPVIQRGVLLGVTIAAVLFEVLHTSSTIRHTGLHLDEGNWWVVRMFEAAVLVAACWCARRRPSEPASPALGGAARRQLYVLVAVGIVTVSVATTHEWVATDELVGAGLVGGRSPLIEWHLLLVLPVAISLIWTARRLSVQARTCLATVAGLGAVAFFATAAAMDEVGVWPGPWLLASVAHLGLAGVAVWTLLAGRRRHGVV